MHTPRPLKRDKRPFQSGQKVEGQCDGANRETGEQHQGFRLPCHVDTAQGWGHQVPDDQNRQIGGAIVGAVILLAIANLVQRGRVR